MAVVRLDVDEHLDHVREPLHDGALHPLGQLVGLPHGHPGRHEHVQVGLHRALGAARAEVMGILHARHAHRHGAHVLVGNARMIGQGG